MMRLMIVALVLLLLLGVTMATPPPTPKTLEVVTPSACIFHVENDVQILRQGATAAVTAHAQDVVKPGDGIRTGDASVAILLLWDKSTMKIAPNTRIVIEDLSETEDGNVVRRFTLQAGKVWSDVEKHPGTQSVYEVQTPHGLASVKGTTFEVGEDSEGYGVKVWEGTVAYGGRNVPYGQTFVALGRGPLTQVPLNRMQQTWFEQYSWSTHQHMAPILASMPRRISPARLRAEHVQALRTVFIAHRRFIPPPRRVPPPPLRRRVPTPQHHPQRSERRF